MEADHLAIQAGRRLEPKGTGGTILEHVTGRPTKYISAGEALKNVRKFDTSGFGIARISVERLEETGSSLVPFENVLQVARRQGTGYNVTNVQQAREVLIKGGIDPSAIVEIIH